MKRKEFSKINPSMESKDQISSYIDSIFDQIYALIDVPDSSLYHIVRRVKDSGLRVDPQLLQIILQNKLNHNFASLKCPHCNKALVEKYTQQRELVTTIGTITLSCPYCYCRSCKTSYTPYETALNLRPGKYQHDAQKIIARMASSETFEESAEMLNEIYGFGIAADTVHTLTNQLAEDIQLTEIIPTAEAIEQVVDSVKKGKHRRPVFVFAADGAMAPIRSDTPRTPNCWKEVRGIRGYLIDEDHIVHLLSWHQISTKQEFLGFLHELSDNNLIPRDKVRLCFVGDGAQWIWDCVQEVFPECRQVLDYYHCAEHLHAFANAHFGSSRGKEWIEATKARLFDNNAIQVIAGLKRMKCVTDESRKNRDSLVNYLSNHKNRIDYGKQRRGGFPSGSGAIESANKFISHIRLKRSGAWWKVVYANNILKLRCAKYNGKFNEYFDNFEKLKQQPVDAQPLGRDK
jgi:hypothetical protein